MRLFETAKWIYSLDDKITIETINDALSISYYDLDVIKWLYSLGAYIRTDDDKQFKYYCEDNCIEFAEWFCNVCDDYEFIVENNKITSFRIHKTNKELRNAVKDNKLDGLFNESNNYIDINNDNIICCNCINDDYDKWIQLKDCKHIYCIDCYINLDQCLFNCEGQFDDIILLKINR